MSEVDDTKPAASAQVPSRRKRRQLTTGSVTEMADWLLGLIGDATKEDFGALRQSVTAGGALMLCGRDHIWRPFSESEAYQLLEHFDGAEYTTPEDKMRAVQMSLDLARRVYRTIEAKQENTHFFSSRPNGLAFRNGFLRISDDGGCRLEELTPECRATRMLPFDYVAVPAPESFTAWRAFLASVWGATADEPADLESIALVHQMIGYLLSGSNDQQKVFLMLGPPRCGKGTIVKLLFKLLGPDAGAFKLAGLDQNFGLEAMVGKSVCVDSDVRRSKSMHRDEGKIVERVLGITSGDVQDIPRKNRTALATVLPTRLVLCSNPPFSVRDVGGAMASRIITLPFRTSYLGREIFDLEHRLAAELPAIVALAMQAMKTFRAQGRFVEPSSAAEMREEIEQGQNPLREFFQDWCIFEKGLEVPCQDLFGQMRLWATENGNIAPSAQSFGSALKQLGVGKSRPRADGKRGVRHYMGVALRPAAEDSKPSPYRAPSRLRTPADGVATITPIRSAP